MKLKSTLLCLILSMLIANSESLKVIFARNTTAAAQRTAEAERIAAILESRPDMSSIINIPGNCKPGFVYESTFHNRCRKVAG